MVSLIRPESFVFAFGGHETRHRVQPGEVFRIFTEDCFSGKLDRSDGEPRKVAPFPYVNPLTGPIEVAGLKAGDVVAIHILKLEPARNWGVATISPDFGLLSGTRVTPNLQPPQDEHVFMWRFDETGTNLKTGTQSGDIMSVPFRPFFGTVGVAPAHGEVRLSVAPGDFGGNLDIPDLTAGTTLYLKANMDGGHLYFGDGHYAQGDGEISGTAIEGAFNAEINTAVLPIENGFDWPRMETDTEFGVVGCARPLEDAVRIAVAGTIRWVSAALGLTVADAHQLVSQSCRLRIGNLVNPSFSVVCMMPKSVLGTTTLMGSVHDQLRISHSDVSTSAQSAPGTK